MKNKFKLYGIIVLVAIIGLSMVACNVGTSPIGDAVPGKVVVQSGDELVIFDKDKNWLIPNITTNSPNDGGLKPIKDVENGQQALLRVVFGLEPFNAGSPTKLTPFVLVAGAPGSNGLDRVAYSKLIVYIDNGVDYVGGNVWLNNGGTSSFGTQGAYWSGGLGVPAVEGNKLTYDLTKISAWDPANTTQLTKFEIVIQGKGNAFNVKVAKIALQ